jgi:hypothetical protein
MSTATFGSNPVPETNTLVVGGPTVGVIITTGMVVRVSSALTTVLQSKHALSSKSSVSVKDRRIALLVQTGMNQNAGDGSTKERLRCIVRLVYVKFSGPRLIVWLFGKLSLFVSGGGRLMDGIALRRGEVTTPS